MRAAKRHKSNDMEELGAYSAEEPIPEASLDLDLPPETRWTHICKAYKPRFDKLLRNNADVMASFDSLTTLSPAIARVLPESQRAEADAIAAALEVSSSLVLLFQIVYEVFSLTDLMEDSVLGCTTVVHEVADGVVHARTLDWCWLEGLEELLVTLHVVKGERLLYKCTSVVGYLGVLTGMREDGFSISLNYRRPFRGVWKEGPDGEMEPQMEHTWGNTMQSVAALAQAMIGAWPVASMIRSVLEECEDFGTALRRFREIRLIAPCFVTIAGCHKDEGVILTCDSGTGKHEQSISDPASGGIVAVSNLDPHAAEFPTSREALLDGPDGGALLAKDVCQGESLLRRDFALKWLRTVRVSTCEEGIASVTELIKTIPIANEATLYDTVMCPAAGLYRCDRSAGMDMLLERGFDGDMCSHCCLETCDQETCCFLGRKAGGDQEAKTAHGSLVRRQGGAYYCARHLALAAGDLSTRS